MPETNTIYNDNCACVEWSKKMITKGLLHIQMCEHQLGRILHLNLSEYVTLMGKSILLIYLPRRWRILLILWSFVIYSCVLTWLV